MKNTLLLIAVFFATVVFGQDNSSAADNNTSLANFQAMQKGTAVQLFWTALNETGLNSHEVQKSANGTSFTNIGTLVAENNAAPYQYNFLDATPVEGNNYYRLQTVDKKGNVAFSDIIRVNNGTDRTDVKVLPNPVHGGVLNLQMNHINSGKYAISLYSNGGHKVFARSLNLTDGSTTQTINLPRNLASGIYFLQITDGAVRINKQVLLQ